VDIPLAHIGQVCGASVMVRRAEALQEPCQPVQDERSGDSNIEAGARSDHRDLNGEVE
jgi:hypothetical protein